MESKNFVKGSAILAIALIICGVVLSFGIIQGRKADRVVTVKGLAERKVKADQASWKISYISRGEDLNSAVQKNLSDRELILKIFVNAGLKDDEIRPGIPRVNQTTNYKTGVPEFSVTNFFNLVSHNIEAIKGLSRESHQFLKSGVALSGWESPSFFFSTLSEIKPKMIEEATLDARKAALKFAQDSKSQVGQIKRASQGYFSFRGEAGGLSEREQDSKIARVVITVDYFLK